MYRLTEGGAEVFLVHPGGPYFARKDEGVWTIPKGEPGPDEDPLICAIREFGEETGMLPRASEFVSLGQVTQRGGKTVHAWAFEGQWEQRELRSNTFELEWPPRSGRQQSFPEIDRAAFFSLTAARRKLNPAQCEFLDRLGGVLQQRGSPHSS